MGRLPRQLARLLLIGLAGCAGPLGGARHGANAPSALQVELPGIARGSVEAGLHALPTLPQRDGVPVSELPPTPPYRALTAAQCQCMAAAAAVPASLADLEGGGGLRRDILAYAAFEVRNRSAGSALEAYYHLAEAEGKADLLAQSVTELERAVRETKRMTAQKLKPPVELDVWLRQLLTSQSDLIQADMTITQLNGELRRLIGLADCTDGWRIWNPEGYDVSDSPIDVEAAVAEGLARRAELNLLRHLIQELNERNLPAARDLLKSVHLLLGHAPHPGIQMLENTLAILHLKLAGGAELETRRQQLMSYLHDREVAVADEVRQAAASMRSHARLVSLTWARERSWEEKVRDVQSRQQQGLASFAEVISTNLEMLKARAEVIQEVMAWHVARAKLRQAQGLLAAECFDDGCTPNYWRWK